MTFVAKTFEAGPLRPVRDYDDWRQRHLMIPFELRYEHKLKSIVGQLPSLYVLNAEPEIQILNEL